MKRVERQAEPQIAGRAKESDGTREGGSGGAAVSGRIRLPSLFAFNQRLSSAGDNRTPAKIKLAK